MTAHYGIAQVVRTYPVDGVFETLEIEGFKGEQLVVRNSKGTSLLFSRDDVELFSFTGKYGEYNIQDEVSAPGFQGTWKIKSFTQSPRNLEQEWGACLINKQTGKLLFWPAHLLMKV